MFPLHTSMELSDPNNGIKPLPQETSAQNPEPV